MPELFRVQLYNGDTLPVQVAKVNDVIITISISLKSVLRTQTYQPRRLNVFENRVLRRIFGPKRDEVTGEWRKLHSDEVNDLYCSPNLVRVIKSKRMGWAGHVARMKRGQMNTGFWWGNLRERDSGVDGRKG